jgi:RHS repeat-associated protein
MDTSKNRLFTARLVLTTLCLLLTCTSIFAKEKRTTQAISGGTIAPSATISVADSDPYSAFYTQRSESFVELKIDNEMEPHYWYIYTINLKIYPVSSTLGPLAPYTTTMAVQNYRHGGLGDYIDFQSQKIPGATAGATVEVLSVDIWNNDQGYSVGTTPDNISLTVAYETERYYELPTVSLNTIGIYSNFDNRVVISWDAIYQAEEYELEWTWVDNYNDSDITTPLSPSVIYLTEREFEQNSTRIQTKNNTYSIPSIYSRGYLVYRVRMVARHHEDYTKRYNGEWSSVPSDPTLIDAWTYVTITDDHQKGLNWQFQASYAEDGKKKEVVSYFDGSLRNRQTVTRMNTTGKAIIGEVIYDEEGRPAIEILPAPVKDEILKYYPNFNQNIYGKSYSYKDLEPDDPNAPCNVLVDGMASGSGASNYYSPTNSFGQDGALSFIPNAENYPFSQTEYTHDNTGRINRKGGVGQQYQLGSGHEMKYLYSVPAQEELNRLFGYSVGYSAHYKKNVVIDPNGQVSTNYLDPQGRTVATALLSGSPEYVHPLSDEQNGSLHQYMVIDLLNKLNSTDNDTPLDNNEKYATGNYDNLNDGLRYDAHKVFTSAGTQYNFNYSILKPAPFIYQCSSNNYYYPTIYNLELDVTDECGSPIYTYPQSTPYLQLGSYSMTGELVQLVSPTTSINHTVPESLFTITPPVGSYGISKKLTVDKPSLDLFTEDYIKRGLIDGCIFPPQSPQADLTGCFYTCDECVNYYEQTIGATNYINQMLASNSSLNELQSGSQEYNDLLNLLTIRYQREYELIIEACKKPCETDGYSLNGAAGDINSSMMCDNSLTILLGDVMPSGQYGIYPKTFDADGNVLQNVAAPGIETLPMSVYNENNQIYTFVKGTDPDHQNWRYPHYFDADNIFPYGSPNSAYKHYFTEFGEIDYVDVMKNDDNTYSPPVQNTSNLIAVSDNLYKIEPQYLANVSDFIALIGSRPNWAYSLVKYHPEFHYLDYRYAMCGIVNNGNLNIPANTPISFNSDGFDAFIGSMKTFSEAEAAGMLASEISFCKLDPYFLLPHPLDGSKVDMNTGGASGVEVLFAANCQCGNECPDKYLQLRRSVIEQSLSLTSNSEIPPQLPTCNGPAFSNGGKYQGYEGSYEKSMFVVIYENIRCNGLDFACDLPPNATFTDVMTKVTTEFTTEEQDLFWQYYVTNYLGIKQKLQHVFSNLYAYRQGAYNDCIGQESQNTNRIRSVINNYPSESNHVNNQLMGGAPASNQTLFSHNGTFLKDKEKRFLPHDQLYDSETEDHSGMLTDANAVLYQQTGICPSVRDMEIFLNGLVKKTSYQGLFAGAAPSAPQPIINFLTPYLFEILGCSYSSSTPSVNTYEILSNVNSSYILNIDFSQSYNYNSSAITLKLDGSYGFTWDSYGGSWDISGISQLTATGYDTSTGLYSFSALATARIVGVVEPVDIVLKGYTKATLNCSSDPGSDYANDPNNGVVLPVTGDNGITCNRKEKFTAALKDLIISMQQNGTLHSTSPVNLLANPTYTNGFLPEFFASEEAGYVVWTYYPSVNMFEIRIGSSSTTNYPRLRIEGLNLYSSLLYLSVGQLTSTYAYTAHDILAVTYGGITTGIVNDSNESLEFSCCRVGNPNALTLNDFFETSKQLYNEIIDYAVYCYENNINTVTTVDGYEVHIGNYESPLVEALSHYYANEETFGVYNAWLQYSSYTNTSSIQFQHGDSNDGGPDCVTPVWIYANGDLRNGIRIDKIVNNGGVYDPPEGGYGSGTFEYFDAIMTDGNNAILPVINRVSCLKTITNLPACPCIPQPVAAVSGDDMYNTYISHLSNFGLSNYYKNPQYSDIATFKGMNLQYIVEGYMNYLAILGITNINHPQYISLAAFGGSALNYGYNDYPTVINAFASQINLEGGIKDWVTFVDSYLASHPEICPPRPMIPTININIKVDNPCTEFNLNVAEAYNASAYEDYINGKKDAFRKAYLADALANVSENFKMRYYDKEYQYTLYYYDQAGNLIQTVSPEGINRLNAADYSINNHRITNPADNTALLPAHTLKTEYKYNSLNQLVWQKTPDGGVTKFAYDALGRIVASQNEKQLVDKRFSYTRYDNLGRITEAGEMKSVAASINSLGRLVNTSGLVPVSAVTDNYPYNISTTCYEVTRTLYDDYHDFNPNNFLTPADFRNTRNRVTTIITLDTSTGPGDEANYETAIFYNYDIHGNVDEMVQSLSGAIIQGSYTASPFLTRLNYEYDLISGNVNKVTFQRNLEDQFIHKYTYDADNRITSVVTSKDGVIWENEASYEYYPHGPLARTILGDKQVQGIDYAYTLQGWLKTVNADNLDDIDNNDMGRDGINGGTTSRDAFAYSLSYNDNDYKPVNDNTLTSIFANQYNYGLSNNNLYNGNIRNMTTHLLNTNQVPKAAVTNLYSYDQLNRIFDMQAYKLDRGSAITAHSSNYTYDRNGNIQTHVTTADGGNGLDTMDDMNYHYIGGTNKLSYISDNVSASHFSVDIDDQSENNYTYDQIGQLTYDQAEKLTIDWRVDGKVKSVKSGNSGSTYKFYYNGLGQRVAKNEINKDKLLDTHLYGLDAQGNTMGVYAFEPNEENEQRLMVAEHHIYGSSRLGMQVYDKSYGIPGNNYYRRIGDKRYELSNHLGNVLSIVTDRKVIEGEDKPLQVPDVLGTNDYYPFGMLVPDAENTATSDYRYGFNGKEKDNELKGEGNSYDFGARMYDPRIGRWFATDPLEAKYSNMSPYIYCANNPIIYIDPDGRDWVEGKNGNITWRKDVSSKNQAEVLKEGEIYRGKSYERIKEWSDVTLKNGNKVSDIVLENYGSNKKITYSKMTSASISVVGSIIDDDPTKAGYGQLSINLKFANGQNRDVENGYFEISAGGFGNGAPENGNYTVTNYNDRSKKSGWYNKGMNRDGVGFSFNLNPLFKTGRTDLRIHPDGNNFGTKGCIGLLDEASALNRFSLMIRCIMRHQNGAIPLTINIGGNPNNDGLSKNNKSNAHE